MTAATARFLLRQETADLHAELDAHLSRADFDDRRSYGAFLHSQARPLFALEQTIAGSSIRDDITDWAGRSRSDAIRADLVALGLTPPLVAPVESSFQDPDRLFGALYVLEGSRLGAVYLSRHARASRDPAVREAVRYLTHGEGRSLWPSFLSDLAHREAAGLDPVKLVDGARKAFAMFLRSARTGMTEPVSS